MHYFRRPSRPSFPGAREVARRPVRPRALACTAAAALGLAAGAAAKYLAAALLILWLAAGGQ